MTLFFFALMHQSSDLICCSFHPPYLCLPPLLPTNGLNGSGSQSATPVGGKIIMLLLYTPLSVALLPSLCCLNFLSRFTCKQKDCLKNLPLWLRHARICSHGLLHGWSIIMLLNTLLWSLVFLHFCLCPWILAKMLLSQLFKIPDKYIYLY